MLTELPELESPLEFDGSTAAADRASTHHSILLVFTLIWGSNFVLAEVALRAYVVQGAELHARLLQTVAHRMLGKTRVVLLAREALLLGGRDDFTVDQERGGAVVIKRGNAQYFHDRCGFGEDGGGALRTDG